MMGHEDDASNEDEGLEIEEDGDEGQLKFQSFRTEDMSNPSFKVGMIFDSVENLRVSIAE